MRKIEVEEQNYQIRPSFILPYCRAKTDVALQHQLSLISINSSL
ncbi:MAG: hypothetical protein R3E32_11895 [Chitinophagales bacterium]